MKRDQAKTVEDRSCSIQESAQCLGLDSFTVHSLIQRRKLVADVTHCGELAISRKELHRVLAGAAISPNPARVVQAISEKCAQAVSLEENEKNGQNIPRHHSRNEILHRH
jgi:hypothetical protein